jgi:hypothetical protein
VIRYNHAHMILIGTKNIGKGTHAQRRTTP